MAKVRLDAERRAEMNTITREQKEAIAARLDGMTLPSGLGTEESACSIAAINLALTGELTDDIPACMSEVIGRWIIATQDTMPAELRNSPRWKSLLPLAAGTGREMERERIELVMAWLWVTVLPALQPVADRGGFGYAWKQMTTHRTDASAYAAADAAWAAHATEAEAAHAADAAAAHAADAAAAHAAEAAAAHAAEAAEAAEAADAARAAWAAAYAAADAAADAARALDAEVWETFDPCGLLEQLIRVGEQK
jgi:hypothetical protein